MNDFNWIEDQLDYIPPPREDEEFEKELSEALWMTNHTREDIDNGTLRVGVRRVIVHYRRFKRAWENMNNRPFDINEITVDGRIYE